MKKEEKKIDKITPKDKERNISEQERNNEDKDDFPGYPHYPASEDIFNREKEVDLNTEDLTKVKNTIHNPGERNQKSFLQDMTGEDLDIPGSKADEAKSNAGKEDEENNYYSLGGDNHNDLEEDNG